MSRLLSCKGLLAISVLIIGCIGLVGSLRLPITDKYTLGPGGAPLVYASGVIITGLLLAISSLKDKKEYSFNHLLTSPAKQGLIFVILLFVSAGAIYLFGYPIVLFCLSFLGLVLVEGWKVSKALLFSTIWTTILYILFVKLLNVRLMAGILF